MNRCHEHFGISDDRAEELLKETFVILHGIPDSFPEQSDVIKAMQSICSNENEVAFCCFKLGVVCAGLCFLS